jgi:hypothetical protein
MRADIPPKGPMALPGTYQVRLTVAGKGQTAPLELAPGPAHALDARKEPRKAVRAGAADLARRLTALHRAVNEIRDLRAQLNRGLERALPERRGLAAAEAAGGRVAEEDRRGGRERSSRPA